MNRRLLPNWLDGYMAYTAESEAPELFHVWTALTTVAGAMRRRSFFEMGYFRVYPNLYVVLVGPAGSKKSTAMNVGKKMLAQVAGVEQAVDSTTRERLILDLSTSYKDGHSSMTAFSSEFGSFVTNSAMDMILFLTDIYESPIEWTHRTKSGGTNKIKAPCLNLEACTTPDWLARALPLDTVGIGLTSRILFIYQHEPRIRPAFPVLSPEQKELEQILVHDLNIISEISGQYTLTPDAKIFYEEWYVNRRSSHFSLGDSRLNGYFERKPMHLLKVAMILSAATKDETLITTADLDRAFYHIDHAEKHMKKAFTSVGKNPLAFDIEQVLAAIMLAESDGLAYGTLLDQFKHSVRKEELDEVLQTLMLIGLIENIHEPMTGAKYYAVGAYRNGKGG